ncbi:MAG: hypothetical protein Q3M24_03925 [Candidatus Electrothrix aestuarii]|uniref:Uncharacterized protein n=1 Tax=Candidatus Electrothrix aestuarii TaxID=3062594 RepID=A0AAU8LXD0_9BACT|nr:hypothetical protein [Candidatus Electrothrix aestuarii]
MKVLFEKNEIAEVNVEQVMNRLEQVGKSVNFEFDESRILTIGRLAVKDLFMVTFISSQNSIRRDMPFQDVETVRNIVEMTLAGNTSWESNFDWSETNVSKSAMFLRVSAVLLIFVALLFLIVLMAN